MKEVETALATAIGIIAEAGAGEDGVVQLVREIGKEEEERELERASLGFSLVALGGFQGGDIALRLHLSGCACIPALDAIAGKRDRAGNESGPDAGIDFEDAVDTISEDAANAFERALKGGFAAYIS